MNTEKKIKEICWVTGKQSSNILKYIYLYIHILLLSFNLAKNIKCGTSRNNYLPKEN